jgi:hypothetical protein
MQKSNFLLFLFLCITTQFSNVLAQVEYGVCHSLYPVSVMQADKTSRGGVLFSFNNKEYEAVQITGYELGITTEAIEGIAQASDQSSNGYKNHQGVLLIDNYFLQEIRIENSQGEVVESSDCTNLNIQRNGFVYLTETQIDGISGIYCRPLNYPRAPITVIE